MASAVNGIMFAVSWSLICKSKDFKGAKAKAAAEKEGKRTNRKIKNAGRRSLPWSSPLPCILRKRRTIL